MKLLWSLLGWSGARVVDDLYEEIEGTNDLRFRNDTEFYRVHKDAILRGSDSDCMRSAEFPQDNGSGSKTYPGVYWADQIPSKDVVDYEKCVYYITGARMMHSDAESACASNVVSKCSTLDCPATLVSVHTSTQNDAIFTHIASDSSDDGKPYWIGMRQFCDSCPFENNDHSPVDFVSWDDGEPNNDDGDEDCVEYYSDSKKWNDNNCRAKRQFICQVYLNKGFQI